MGKKLAGITLILGVILSFGAPESKADIVDIDTVGLPDAVAAIIADVEADITETVANDFSPTIPRGLRGTLRKIELTATIVAIDGPGGVLAQAAVTEFAELHTQFHDYAIAQVGFLQIDTDTINEVTPQGLFDICKHEVLHAMGFNNNAWDLNGLLVDGPFGRQNYGGANGLVAFREESGIPTAQAIPLETLGGAGTAGSHWALGTPFLDQTARGLQDVMLGFFDPSNTVFTSETTIGAMRDVHLTMSNNGFNPTAANPPGPPIFKRPPGQPLGG